MALATEWEYNLVEPGSGKVNGNESLGTEGSGIVKDIPAHL